MKQAKKFIVVALLFWCRGFVPVFAEEDANAILDQIRLAQAEINKPLTGRLRPEDGAAIPFQLRLRGSQIDYQFTNPPETIRLQLTDSGSILSDEDAGGRQNLSGSKLQETVRGTDITYEDLSLRFIYWKNAKLNGEQRVRAITCSVVDVQPASRNTAYSTVRLWIAKDRGALIKAEGFDWQGRLVKRFEIISGQRVEGKTIFKQIRIERISPETGKVVSRTYLELDPSE
ncbi:MAG TPA: outer membrane lipoprotein-sorting protein [Chthoniobacterales bacterium]|nr:outer membrane lipoprotein-sorting protein [Chthoniobacterales bacterium]